jgi:putative Mg2+ transporter-C (MgtC) family protein
MGVFDSVRTDLPEHIILARLLLAAVLGGLVGIDRELKQRPAGLRTHILVAMGAATFAIITLELIAQYPGNGSDPVRVIEAVTAGVAFLAAGAIIQSKGEVQGVTTGASMWLTAALGVACGAGDYSIAVMATLLTLFVLAVLTRVERWMSEGRESPGLDSSSKQHNPDAEGN